MYIQLQVHRCVTQGGGDPNKMFGYDAARGSLQLNIDDTDIRLLLCRLHSAAAVAVHVLPYTPMLQSNVHQGNSINDTTSICAQLGLIL